MSERNEKRSLTKYRQETFKLMLEKDCKEYTKKSPANNANYLSWSYAWQEFKKIYPFAYCVNTKNEHGTYEFKDSFGTYFVEVTVHNGGEKSNGEYIEESHTVALPIMDNKHKPMKAEAYEYTTSYGKKTVAGATSFDTNYALQRAKTKAISDFGLGLYIYHGETIPKEDDFINELNGSITNEKAKKIFWQWLLDTGVQNKTISAIYNKLDPKHYIKNGELNDEWKGHAKIMFQEFNEVLTDQLIEDGVDVTTGEKFTDSIEEFKHLINLKNKRS